MVRSIKGLLIAVLVAMIIGGIPLSSSASESDTALKGVPLKDQEMNEIRGGFQMSNGDMLYFSMDYMRVRFLSSSDPGSAASGTNSPGWVNMLSQKAVITKDGIAFDMQVVQAGGENGNAPAPSATWGNNASTTTPSTVINNNTGTVTANFLNNSGITNANFNTGTGNVTQSIANVININVGFFNVGNASQMLPALRGWLNF